VYPGENRPGRLKPGFPRCSGWTLSPSPTNGSFRALPESPFTIANLVVIFSETPWLQTFVLGWSQLPMPIPSELSPRLNGSFGVIFASFRRLEDTSYVLFMSQGLLVCWSEWFHQSLRDCLYWGREGSWFNGLSAFVSTIVSLCSTWKRDADESSY